MKNWRKCSGIIALVAVIGFSLAACDNGNDNGGGGGALGATLNLSGQVYTVDWDADYYTLVPYTGNSAVYSDLGGSGSITNGQLSFGIGIPSEMEKLIEYFGWFSDLENFSLSPTAAQGNFLSLGTPTGYLSRENSTFSSSEGVSEEVMYIYVDRDTTISASRTVKTEEFEDEEYDAYTMTTNAFNITLKEGWNSLHSKWTYTRSGDETLTISLKNPNNLKWVIDED